MTTLCRDCIGLDAGAPSGRCPHCGSTRLIRHDELATLSIAHLDCDAFYASVEKRDRPELASKPVIVGGRSRGVVAACCYVARLYGVRSAMPMFKALSACPDAVVIPPNMAKYVAVGREVRRLMLETTPLVEAISIDEAFLDLSGTEALHGGPPAQTLAALARRVESALGVTISIGLSYNKFLAKVASDLDKPRGFAVIGRAEAMDFLKDRPVGLLWGVGAALQRRLAGQGITRIGHLVRFSEADLVTRYGAIGRRLHRFARGEDLRRVTPEHPTKSISAETTFSIDLTRRTELSEKLWPLCEKVARRLKTAGLTAGSAVLKLKTADFQIISRTRRLDRPTQSADAFYQAGLALLDGELDGTAYRLIGIGGDALSAVEDAASDLFTRPPNRQDRLDQAVEAVREKLGEDAIGRARGVKG